MSVRGPREAEADVALMSPRGRRGPGCAGWLLLLIAAAGVTLLAWAFWWEPGRLIVNRAAFELPEWHAGARTRIAVIADLHVGSPRNGLDNLRRVVDRLNGLRPEVVLIAGDLVIDNVLGGRFVPPEEIAAILAGIETGGVYAVLGNHDRWLSAERVTAALRAAGVVVVENRGVRVRLSGGSVWMAGASDYWTGHPDLERALDGARPGEPVILLTHNPDLFVEVPERVALTVAGHTHGGQVVLPFIGRAITPSRFGDRFAAGLRVEDGRHLFVTTGIGTSRLGVRFLVPPEIALLEIRGPAPGATAAVRPPALAGVSSRGESPRDRALRPGPGTRPRRSVPCPLSNEGR